MTVNRLVLCLVLCLVLLCATAGSLSLVPLPATAGTSSSLVGLRVPDGQLQAVKSAALSCPMLSPPRLAAQLMEASKFNPHATTAGGGSGVAGLTAAQWRRWTPGPGAARSDVSANIVALAHDICDLVGRVRVAGVPGDLWRLALAAFHSGLRAVITARAIPVSAVGYVNAVAGYADWYAQQTQFGSIGVTKATTASPRPSRTTTAHPKASPTPGGSAPVSAPVSGATQATADPADGWRLEWSDEFSGSAGSAPDASKWGYDTGGSGWGNSELEDYTTSTANAALNGSGQLVITARKGGVSGASCWYGACRYSSARLTTLGRFSQAYGQISARIKLPSGQGIWPSFWALGDDISSAGWRQAGQLDIMTSLGGAAAQVSGGLIGPTYNNWWNDSLSNGTFADGYHTFTADWYPDHISFFVDGHLYGSQYRAQDDAGWVFDHPFYLLLNLAVGGTEPGNPDAGTVFPQRMLVDWVRVYRAGPPPAAVTGRITGLAGTCVEASGSGAAQLDACTGSSAQTWTIGRDGTVQAQGKCLGVTATGNGTRALLSACDGTAAQTWQPETNGQLVNSASGRCLDATGKSSANLTPLQIWDCWGTVNQLWTLP